MSWSSYFVNEMSSSVNVNVYGWGFAADNNPHMLSFINTYIWDKIGFIWVFTTHGVLQSIQILSQALFLTHDLGRNFLKNTLCYSSFDISSFLPNIENWQKFRSSLFEYQVQERIFWLMETNYLINPNFCLRYPFHNDESFLTNIPTCYIFECDLMLPLHHVCLSSQIESVKPLILALQVLEVQLSKSLSKINKMFC